MAADWQAATRDILDRLDLLAEYRELGVQPASSKPSAKGWLPCRVFGNPDERNASAGINVSGEHPQLGRYKEFTGESRNVSFFEFAAAVAGRFGSWEEARKHYAEKTGVELPKEKRLKSPADNLVFRDWIEHQVAAWCATKPPITPEAVRDAGGRLAGWPAKTQAHTVIALPIYGPHLADDDESGWLIWNKTGRPLPLFRGKGESPEPKKMLIVGGSTSGWMGRWGLEHLESAEVVWKTEGPGDMLALMSIIPPELRERHVVIANAGGSREKLAPEFWESLRGKRVYVIHDCDRDGQLGGQEQAELAARVAAEVRHVTLPLEIRDNHGQDLRDWINKDVA